MDKFFTISFACNSFTNDVPEYCTFFSNGDSKVFAVGWDYCTDKRYDIEKARLERDGWVFVEKDEFMNTDYSSLLNLN
jgi:hypothetical protein